MTIEEITNIYYPNKKEMDRIALFNFVGLRASSISGDQKAITNALYRNGIRSISDLQIANIDDIKRIRHLGDKRIGTVRELKEILNNYISEEES